MTSPYRTQNTLRLLLRQDGPQTVPELFYRLGGKPTKNSIRDSLRRMPDAYIKRYRGTGSRPVAVWAVVVPPPDAVLQKKKSTLERMERG